MKLHPAKKITYQSGTSKNGKLLKQFKPAAFCDTSFLFDYWSSIIHSPLLQSNPFSHKDQVEELFLEYTKAHSRTKNIYQIRKRIEDFDFKLNLIYTPACRLELEEIITASRFKKYGIEVSESTSSFVKKGNKEIGDILLKLKKNYTNDLKKSGALKMDENLKLLFNHFFFTTDRINEGLEGIIEFDIINFSLAKKELKNLIYFANMQVGFADLFHLLSAFKLGCKYFFTFDTDFKRIKEEVAHIYKIEIVTELPRMLALL
jgi:hypothetical protein